MIVALILLGYAILLVGVVPRLLRGADWADRAPRLAIMAWQATTVSVVASVAMAGLALTVPTVPVSGNLAEWLHSCVMALREQYATPGGAAAGATGAVLALSVIGRTGWLLCAGASRTARERAGHRRVLDMVGWQDYKRGIVVLECDEAAVYCLPGLRNRTVVTTAALRSLDDRQLTAVLAHERAHLVERHDLVVAVSSAFAAAFPAVGLFRLAADETARLVELRADDVAALRTDRFTLAGALLAVVSGGSLRVVPGMALGAGGNGAAARVRRLIPPGRPVSRAWAGAGFIAVVVALFLPVLVLSGPVAVAQHGVCFDPAATYNAST